MMDFNTWLNQHDDHVKQSRLQAQQVQLVNGKGQADGEPYMQFAQRSYNIWKMEEEKKPPEDKQIETLAKAAVAVAKGEPTKNISGDLKIYTDGGSFMGIFSGEFISKNKLDVVDYQDLRKKITLKAGDSLEITKDIVKLYTEEAKNIGLIDYIDSSQVIEEITKEGYVIKGYTISKDIIERNFNPLTHKEG